MKYFNLTELYLNQALKINKAIKIKKGKSHSIIQLINAQIKHFLIKGTWWLLCPPEHHLQEL